MKEYLKQFKKSKLKLQLFNNIINTSVLKAINLLLMFGVTILLARSLGPKNYGIYSFTLSIIVLLGLPTKAGLPLLIVRETAKYQAKKKLSYLHGLLTLSNVFAIIFSILIVTFVTIMSWWIFSDEEIVKTNLLFWALLLLPLITFANIRSAILRGLNKVIQGNLPEQLMQPLLIFILLGVAVWLGNELTPITAMHYNIIAVFVTFCVGATMLKRALPKKIFLTKRNYELKIWSLSFISFMKTKGLIIINSQLALIMLGFLDFEEQVGLYRVAASIAILVSFGLTVSNVVLPTLIAKLHAENDSEKLQEVVTISAWMMFIISLPILLFFIFFGKQLIEWSFGVKYVSASIALNILILGQLINSLTGPTTTVLNMTGNEKQNFKGVLLGLVLNVILSFMLVPPYGLIGAAIATAVSLTAWQLFLVWLTYKQTGMKTFIYI